MKKLIEKRLGKLAKKIVKKYNPQVIGITGSIGKTSTKEAVYAVVKDKFKTRKSTKNYNNELGVPLTILGLESPGRSVFGWLNIFLQGYKMLWFVDEEYPELLLLEMGADKPGDITYLTSIAPCNIGVLTDIGPVHLEQFNTVRNVAREKKVIINHLDKNGFAIVNNDNDEVKKVMKSTKATLMTYGFTEGSDIMGIELETSGRGVDTNGMQYKVTHNGSAVPIFLPGMVGKNAMYASLAAISVGLAYGMNLVDIAQKLREIKNPPGRMNIIEGIKNTLILDDTYNASPDAMAAALQILAQIEVGQENKRIAVLGDMLELGQETDSAHEKIGQLVASLGIDLLITSGSLGAKIARAAIDAGMDDDTIFSFDNSSEAGLFLQDRMKKGDVILVKGSQGARMEKVVKEVMAHPLKASKLLVRQTGKWLND